MGRKWRKAVKAKQPMCKASEQHRSVKCVLNGERSGGQDGS